MCFLSYGRGLDTSCCRAIVLPFLVRINDEFMFPRYLSKSGMEGISLLARSAFLCHVKSALDMEVM